MSGDAAAQSVQRESHRKQDFARPVGYARCGAHRAQRGLIQDRSNIICLVVADLTTAIRSQMVDILTRRLQAIDVLAHSHCLVSAA